jgi:hypothetical protein
MKYPKTIITGVLLILLGTVCVYGIGKAFTAAYQHLAQPAKPSPITTAVRPSVNSKFSFRIEERVTITWVDRRELAFSLCDHPASCSSNHSHHLEYQLGQIETNIFAVTETPGQHQEVLLTTERGAPNPNLKRFKE